MKLKLLSAIILSTGLMSQTFASDAVGPGDSDSKWILGGTLFSLNNPYEGENEIATFSPTIEYNGERFFMKNGSFNYSLFQKDEFSFGITAASDGNFLSNRSEYRDNPILSGLEKRDKTWEAGFYANHTTDFGRTNFTLRTDVGNEHQGQTAALSYTFDLEYAEWRINPVIGINWTSASKTNHYYGVSAAEATASRASYEADSATNYFAGVQVRKSITDHLDFNFQTGIKKFDSTISDSSIVEDHYQYHAGLGLNYNF